MRPTIVRPTSYFPSHVAADNVSGRQRFGGGTAHAPNLVACRGVCDWGAGVVGAGAGRGPAAAATAAHAAGSAVPSREGISSDDAAAALLDRHGPEGPLPHL